MLHFLVGREFYSTFRLWVLAVVVVVACAYELPRVRAQPNLCLERRLAQAGVSVYPAGKHLDYASEVLPLRGGDGGVETEIGGVEGDTLNRTGALDKMLDNPAIASLAERLFQDAAFQVISLSLSLSLSRARTHTHARTHLFLACGRRRVASTASVSRYMIFKLEFVGTELSTCRFGSRFRITGDCCQGSQQPCARGSNPGEWYTTCIHFLVQCRPANVSDIPSNLFLIH